MNEFLPWRIVHHDLRDPLPSVEPESGRGGIYLVLWWNQVPLGHVEIAAGGMPVPPRALEQRVLRAIAPAVGWHLFGQEFAPVTPGMEWVDRIPPLAALRRLEDPLTVLENRLARRRPTLDARSVSVVICTRERPDSLARCLRSIAASKAPPGEVLVVDNAPRTDRTRELVEATPGVRYHRETRPGLSFARNTGVRRSRGEIVAFTDDDVVVHPNWTLELRRAFDDPDVMCVTGLVLPAELETEAQWIFEKGFGGFNRGYRGITYGEGFYRATRDGGVPAWVLGAGANMAIRRSAFASVGLFDERLGAGRSGCSEDSELWYRLLATGLECRYDPVPVVHHHHRVDMEGLDDQMFQYIRGHVAALLVQHANHGDRGNIRRLLGFFPGYFAKRALVRLFAGSDERLSTLPAQIRGWFGGIGFYLRNPGSGPGHRGERDGPFPDRGASGAEIADSTMEAGTSSADTAAAPAATDAATGVADEPGNGAAGDVAARSRG